MNNKDKPIVWTFGDMFDPGTYFNPSYWNPDNGEYSFRINLQIALYYDYAKKHRVVLSDDEYIHLISKEIEHEIIHMSIYKISEDNEIETNQRFDLVSRKFYGRKWFNILKKIGIHVKTKREIYRCYGLYYGKRTKRQNGTKCI